MYCIMELLGSATCISPWSCNPLSITFEGVVTFLMPALNHLDSIITLFPPVLPPLDLEANANLA